MMLKIVVHLVLIAIRIQIITTDSSCGKNGSDNKWPWLAAIFDSYENEYYLCTGTLITAYQLITTATCVHNNDQTQKNPTDILIRLGKSNIDDENYVTAFPSDIFVFTNWKTSSDVALVQFDNPVQLSINIHPICLTYLKNQVINEGVSVEYSANGITEEKISILESEECSSKFPGNTNFSENFICGNRSFCSTKSCGLFIVDDGKWFLHGIALKSLQSKNCNQPIFIKLNQIKDFIEKHSLNFSSDNETQTYSNKTKTRINSRFGIEEGIALVIDGAENFAMKLVQSLNQFAENFIVSSFSIFSSLLVAAEGTEGVSLEELQKTLSFSDLGSLRTAHRTLNYVLSYTRPDDIYKSLVLVTDINRPPARDFEDIAENVYKTEIYPVDFLKPKESMEIIHQYLTNETHGNLGNVVKLEDIIKAQLMLLTVDYFHGKWETSFKKSLTKQVDFFDSYGVVTGQVDMMYQRGSFLFTAVGDLSSYLIELPIGNDQRTSMIIVLPREGMELKKVIQKINQYGFKRIISELQRVESKSGYQDVELGIPRLTYTFNFSLQTVLERMGIKTIFTKEANFLKVSASNSYHISALIHQTKIKINEEGFADFPDVGNYFKSPQLVANRPFLYFIVEKTTNLLMFCGISKNLISRRINISYVCNE